MSRSPRQLPQGHSFHITLRCNSRAFLIAKRLRRDVLLAVLAKAQQKVPHRLYGVCLMANHIHLLLRPSDATQLPKLMHWVSWYSAMLLNRITGRCGHFWEARYYATPIAPKDHQRALNTLRYIHANPKAAGVRQGFYDPYSNYGHYSRLESDGITQWHPSFLQLAPTLTGCSKQYERFCKQYRHHPKPPPKCHWGKRLLNNLLSGRGGRSNSNTRRKHHRIAPGQQHLPFAADHHHSLLPEDWQHIAQQFRHCNAARWSDDGHNQSTLNSS
jgi:putative transposase